MSDTPTGSKYAPDTKEENDAKPLDPFACDWCGLVIVDVRKREDGGKRCDCCQWDSENI